MMMMMILFTEGLPVIFRNGCLATMIQEKKIK